MGNAKGGTVLNFGAYGLKATSSRARDLGAADRGGPAYHHPAYEARRPKLWIRVFPGRAGQHSKPAEVRHGQGQGNT